MNNTSRTLPSNIRSYIAGQVENDELYDDIVEKVAKVFGKNISKGTITKTWNRFQETGGFDDFPRSGRPQIFTPRQEERIVMEVENDPKLTAMDILRDPNLNKPDASLRTIQNLLNKNDLNATTAMPVQMTPQSIEDRYSFALKYDDQPNIWSRIVFSDESDLFTYKSGKLYIRRHTGEYPLAYYAMPTRWDKRTVKVWACISKDGVGPLVRYNGDMEFTQYLNLLNNVLIPQYPRLRGTASREGSLLFQQDGAGPHRHNDVKKWFATEHVYKLEWPGYSPDINPIENLWGLLQDRLYEINDKLKTLDDVWEKAKKYIEK